MELFPPEPPPARQLGDLAGRQLGDLAGRQLGDLAGRQLGDLAGRPLADRMRPETVDEVLGQEHLLGPGRALRTLADLERLHSMILWGPPGSGKTSLARLLAGAASARFVAFSAVLSGVKDIRQVVAEAEDSVRQGPTVLFVDEIHRFNRAQQDAFLPHVERGTIVLVGATTENPSFEINAALLSRCRVYTLEPLAPAAVRALLARALADPERGLGSLAVAAGHDALDLVVAQADGDARRALNLLEAAVGLAGAGADGRRRLTVALVEEAAQKKALRYDKAGEEHYNLISALHKSLRDSDPDAALYWLARMLEAGEDPLFVARRLVRFASEDVGLADTTALELALAARDAYHFLGTPEGELALAHATVHLALAPKSNAVYAAWQAARRDVAERPAEPVPLHLRNAPTRLMAELGYGRGYQYAHDAPDAFVAQSHLPEALEHRRYYQPTDRGAEAELARRLAAWRERRRGAAGA